LQAYDRTSAGRGVKSLAAIVHTGSMRRLHRLIVEVLEVGCQATRLLEWMPGWTRVYHRSSEMVEPARPTLG